MPRTRTPTKILRLKGTHQRQRHDIEQGRAAEPVAEALEKAPPPPRDLPAAGKRAWRDLTARAVELGVLTAVDLGLVRLHAEAAVIYAEARAELDREGVVSKSAAGTVKGNPAGALALAALDRMATVERQFGLSPVARASATAGQRTDETDWGPWAKFRDPPRGG